MERKHERPNVYIENVQHSIWEHRRTSDGGEIELYEPTVFELPFRLVN